MKCPQCDGYGNVTYIVRSGNRIISKEVGECDYCYGTGEVNDWETESTEEPMTNEDCLRSATTEELAGKIYAWHTKGYARGKNGLPLNSITEIVEWLKEKHE